MKRANKTSQATPVFAILLVPDQGPGAPGFFRSAACEPGLDPLEFAALEAQCKGIEDFALALAEQVRDKKLSEEAARKQLAQEYPFLKQGRLEHTWSQAMYFFQVNSPAQRSVLAGARKAISYQHRKNWGQYEQSDK